MRQHWICSPANNKRRSKNQDLCWIGRSSILQNHLIDDHTVCMNYMTETFLSIDYFFSPKLTIIVFSARSKPKEWTKHPTKKFVAFHRPLPSITTYVFTELRLSDSKTIIVNMTLLTQCSVLTKWRKQELTTEHATIWINQPRESGFTGLDEM